MYTGGWRLADSWYDDGFWGKLDAITILFSRINMLIIVIIVIMTVITTILGIVFIAKK